MMSLFIFYRARDGDRTRIKKYSARRALATAGAPRGVRGLVLPPEPLCVVCRWLLALKNQDALLHTKVF